MNNLFTQLINISKDHFKTDNNQEPLQFKGVKFHAEFNDDFRAVKIVSVQASHRGDFFPTQKVFGGELCDLVEVDGTNSVIYKGKKIYHWDLKQREDLVQDDLKYCKPNTANLINEFNKLCFHKSWSFTKKSDGYWSEFWRMQDEFTNKHKDIFEKGSNEMSKFHDFTGRPKYSYGFTFKHDKFLEKFNAHLEKKQITKEKLEKRKRQRELEKARVSDMVQCPVCHGYAEWEKIHGEKVVYDHGFTIGYGHRNNPCFGSRYNCWEKSPKGKQDFLDQILRMRFKFIMRNPATVETLQKINRKIEEVDREIEILNNNQEISLADKRRQMGFLLIQYPSYLGYRISVKLSFTQISDLWMNSKNSAKKEILEAIKMLREWKEQPTLNETKAEIKKSVETNQTKKHPLSRSQVRRLFY